MTAEAATKLTRVYVRQRRVRSSQNTVLWIDEKKTLGWENNLFYQWVKYFTRQVSKQACITCYNPKRLPEIKPVPGIRKNTCKDKTTCFAYCATVMASWESEANKTWTENTTVCAKRLNNFESWTPPLTKVPKGLTHPFCIARGRGIEAQASKSYTKLVRQSQNITLRLLKANCSKLGTASTMAKGGLRLDYRWQRLAKYVRKLFGNAITSPCMPVWSYSTTSSAKIQCEQVVMDGGPLIVGTNNTLQAWFQLPSLKNGTRPLADVFWLCDDDQQVKVTLPVNWTGVCAPVMLTGQITVFSGEPNKTTRGKRDTIKPWKPDDKIYIAWNQEPIGVPDDHLAIGEDWIKSGQGTGWIPLAGPIINSQYIARNSRWVNYLWYNQQRFINWTISSLDGINLQLHETTRMTLQNRFVLDRLLAEEQGVCSYFGDECCTVIPTVTGKDGNLTKMINKLKTLRDEHVASSNWNTEDQGLAKFWEWLNNMSWKKILQVIGMVLGGFLLIVMLIMCIVLPAASAMIKKATRLLPGQFPLQVQNSVNFAMSITEGEMDYGYTEMM